MAATWPEKYQHTAQISQLNEQAKYMPCAAQSLNLIGTHAASVSPLMITCFLGGSKHF